MIFVTVGTLPFTRLVMWMDEFATQTDEEIVMQIANDPYQPQNTDFFKFGSFDTMRKFCKRARIVVCHGGVGSILTALEQGTNVIAVARKRAYGELVDDHQKEIVSRLADEKKIINVDDFDDLPTLLNVDYKLFPSFEIDKRLVDYLRKYIANTGLLIERGD